MIIRAYTRRSLWCIPGAPPVRTANMIYGDNPQKINERQDALGTALYSYKPQIAAILQSGNLHVYAINNPIVYFDRSGKESEHIVQVWECAKQLILERLFSMAARMLRKGLIR